jgi:hypothetical protein
MSEIFYIITTFGTVLANDPGRLLPGLAVACAVTMIIAVTTDTLLRARSLQRRKAFANPPAPKNPRELPGIPRTAIRPETQTHL